MGVRLSAIMVLVFLLAAAASAGEPGITVERGTAPAQAVDRVRLARTLYRHDFENVRDPDTGVTLPESAALGGEQWPDFWEPVRAVGFPEYLIPTVRIVPDESGHVPGNYRDLPNHVLRMDFDGTRVGVRTRTPVPINPDLAYEFSVLVRDEGLDGARIRTGVDWMRIDPAAVEVLRSDEVPSLEPGQIDWPVVPARMLMNDPPARANAAKLFVIVDRDPASIGGAYHGAVWVDNVTLKPLPKIVVGAPRSPESGDLGRVIPVMYSGLFDNVPDPANPGYFRGRRYSRQVEVTDVFGQPLDRDPVRRIPVSADDAGTATEEIAFPRNRFGVYYFNIRLYDNDDRLPTDVMRAVAVMRPPRAVDSVALRSNKPLFGVRAGIVPDAVLANSGQLRTILERSGARTTKIVPWLDSYAGGDGNAAYYASLVDEIRPLRSAGIGITGVIRPPSAMFGDATIFNALTVDPQRLSTILDDAGRQLGLYVDSWQLGDDADGSLRNTPPGGSVEQLLTTLREFAGGLPVIAGARLDHPDAAAFPLRPNIVEGFFPDGQAAIRLWPLAAPLFPWLFEPYFNERGAIYPPPNLSALSPPPALDLLEEQARDMLRSGSWISLDPPPAYSHEPNAASERVQLEELMVRTIYGTVLAPDTVFLGDLFHPGRGLLRRDASGAGMLETMARPVFLAAATMSELLEGAEYLGRLWLLPPYEAHVFRRPGTNESVIAIWHNDAADVVTLQRKEIANGPALTHMDWAGNAAPLPPAVPVRRVPSFILGLPADLALTRMSLRINPEQMMMAMSRRQNQTIEVVNHMPRQTPLLLRLKYAAALPGGRTENGWTLRPEEMRLNLPPVTPTLPAGRMRYSVSPDPNSQIQLATPGVADKSGSKIAQAEVSFNTTPPADMTVYLPFRLRSDLDVEIEQLSRVDDPLFVTLQMKLRWFPQDSMRRRNEIRLTPYYIKRGQMKEAAAFPVTVKADPPEMRGNPNASFESVELRIPRRPAAQTWVGVDEVGGSNFYIVDVSDYLSAE